MSADRMNAPDLIDELVAIVGREHVLQEPADLEFYSTDAYSRGEMPLAVVRPADPTELARVIPAVTRRGLSVVPRGGGASYTDGYLPREPGAVLVDTLRLDRIVEVNAEDMYVTVQCGVTWAALHEALAPRGLRTPFFGPFSGIGATVGASIAQHAVSWGTGTFGVSADSVLGFSVVLADGSTLRTGSGATQTSPPFFRHYGPDLTGLFTGDVGALGIKSEITLRLIRKPSHHLGLSFRFADFDSMARGMMAAAKLGICTLNFGLDPRLQQGQLGKTTRADEWQAAAAVMRSSRNWLDGCVQVARMARAGRRFLRPDTYSAHYVVEGLDASAVRSSAAALRDALAPDGAETASTIPDVVYAMPFAPFHNMLGPRGERWVPMHAILPFSRVAAFRSGLTALYERHAEAMREHRVDYGAMFMTVSTHAFLYEPVFYWEDERNACLERMVPAEHLQSLPRYPPNPAGRALVARMKQEIIALMHSHGATHFQIGKVYPYLEDHDPRATRLLQAIKAELDPAGRINPGALGL
ncbi:MAG TPA: FAD-binding oxidoreductase [Steroidobacteraceae bacterium]|nr:FAD-binding oxidoreductase [Steroidobacteraceae bacterium]